MVISSWFFYADVHDFYKSIFFSMLKIWETQKLQPFTVGLIQLFLSTRHWLEFVIVVLGIKDFDLRLTTKTARSNA